jgi:HAD superfamily phosphatase (TIGR01668 family)
MITVHYSSFFYPNFIAESVLDIHVDELLSAGITHLVLDVDETLVPKRGDELTDVYAKHLVALQEAGITILIGSNTSRDLSKLVQPANLKVVSPSRIVFKPRKAYFKRVIQASGTSKEHIAMAGDRLLNDIIGANRAGLRTILVKPYQRKPSPLYTWYVARSLRHNTKIPD